MRNAYASLVAGLGFLLISGYGISQVRATLQQESGVSGQAELTFLERTLQLKDPSGQSELTLGPLVKIDGQWRTPSGDCTRDGERILCPIQDLGQLTLAIRDNTLRLGFLAQRALSFEAVGLQGNLKLPHAIGWLSHGFQSWSQTGVLSFAKKPSLQEVERALAQTGEAEVYRRGSELSWWYSFLGSDQLSFLAGATTAEQLRSYLQFQQVSSDQYTVVLMSGAGERIAMTADSEVGESWFLTTGPSLQEHMDAYAAQLSSRRKQLPQPALLGWNSWYNYWDGVQEKDILSNLPEVIDFWTPRRPIDADRITITLDDGWQVRWGDWTENQKFPRGLAGLAQDLEAKGVRLGLWFAPFLADPESLIAKNHPDWLVPDISYKNPTGKSFRILDVTHPAVAEHLQSTVKRLLASGVRQLKIDFLFAGAMEGKRTKTVTGIEAYREGLRLIREAAGDDIPIFAVGAPPLGTFDYVDGWRVGGDIAFKPALFGWPGVGAAFISNQARSIAGRQPYCQVTLCDGDPALLRNMKDELVQLGTWVAASAGGAMVLSDNLPAIDSKRKESSFQPAQVTNGLSGQPARLESYFPSQIPPELNNMKDRFFSAKALVPEQWIMPDGTRVRITF